MTKERIDFRKLDALIAEHVLGFSRRNDPELGPGWRDNARSMLYPDNHHALPWFSSNIEDAWMVVEKLRETYAVAIESEADNGLQYPPIPLSQQRWRIDLREHYLTTNPGSVFGIKSLPLAICLIALKIEGICPPMVKELEK